MLYLMKIKKYVIQDGEIHLNAYSIHKKYAYLHDGQVPHIIYNWRKNLEYRLSRKLFTNCIFKPKLIMNTFVIPDGFYEVGSTLSIDTVVEWLDNAGSRLVLIRPILLETYDIKYIIYYHENHC